jgi:hypothetical protein
MCANPCSAWLVPVLGLEDTSLAEDEVDHLASVGFVEDIGTSSPIAALPAGEGAWLRRRPDPLRRDQRRR